MLAFASGLLHFLTILFVWIDCLVACMWWGAASCLFWTDVVDAVPGSGLVGWGHLSVAGRNPFSFPAEQKGTFLDVGNKAGSPFWFRPCTPEQPGSDKKASLWTLW